jgi:phosphate acetyltransferase
MAGIVLGAKVPIIPTSRADSSESRVVSCAIASSLIARAAQRRFLIRELCMVAGNRDLKNGGAV